MKPQHLFAAAAIAAMACGASAQSLKPGLWEITNKLQSSNPQMDQQMAMAQQQMANMPPEQRKMAEEMMARQGVKLGAGGPGGMSMKICMTREMAERNEIPSQRGDCKTTMLPRSGNTMKMSFACANPPSSGEGEYTFSGSDAYSMKMTVNTQVQGKPEKMNMAGSGKWLGADCGDIKPLALPKK